LSINGANEDAGQTGDLDVVRGRLYIVGMTTNVTIDAAGMGDRLFQIFSNAE